MYTPLLTRYCGSDEMLHPTTHTVYKRQEITPHHSHDIVEATRDYTPLLTQDYRSQSRMWHDYSHRLIEADVGCGTPAHKIVQFNVRFDTYVHPIDRIEVRGDTSIHTRLEYNTMLLWHVCQHRIDRIKVR